MKGELKFVITMLGALSVMTRGLLLMLMWPADNLDSVTLVSLLIIEVNIINGFDTANSLIDNNIFPNHGNNFGKSRLVNYTKNGNGICAHHWNVE